LTVRFARLAWVAALVAALAAAQAGTWAEDETEIAACFRTMDQAPELAVVNAKFARRDPTAAQLSDPTFASADEAAALRLRVRMTRPCRALRLEALARHHPALAPAYAALYYQADQVFNYLQQGAIAYGTANRLSAAAFTQFKTREVAYFAASPEAREALAGAWRDELQLAHSNPPPERTQDCLWAGLNIVCS
jgi:hypothetical protein